MTNRQLKTMLIYEGLFYAMSSVAVAFILSLAVGPLDVYKRQVLRGGDQKACRAAGRVADGVVRGGLQQLHHHFPDVLGYEYSVAQMLEQCANRMKIKC